MSSDVSTETHCAYDNKIKIRPGSTITLSEDLQLPSGSYYFCIEHEKKDSSLRKNHGIAASGEVIVTVGAKEGVKEVLKSDVDFKEHPFIRELNIPETVIEDGASDMKETPIIKVLLTMVSTAHIKKIRLHMKVSFSLLLSFLITFFDQL